MKTKLLIVLLIVSFRDSLAQDNKEKTAPEHYMPMYLDMPAELNVRKGYKEINIGYGMANFRDFSGIRSILEYDFAPINNLGFEIEIPFIFINNKYAQPTNGSLQDIIVPEEGGNVQSAMALRLGFNYTIHSFQKAKASISIGYFNEFESSPFVHFGKPIIEGNVYNPFFSVAKIWGKKFHTMIYAGTATRQEFGNSKTRTVIRFNPTISYRLRKDNFIALEVNHTWAKEEAGQMVLRPQVLVQIAPKWKCGFVGGVPVETNNHLKISGILRLIYSPK